MKNKKNLYIYFVKNFTSVANITPYQRYKIINSLQGVTVWASKNKSQEKFINVYYPPNAFCQFLDVLILSLKGILTDKRVILWSAYESPNLAAAYLIKKIIADIWDDPGLQIEVNKNIPGTTNKIKQKTRMFLYNFVKDHLFEFDKIIFSIMPDVVSSFKNYNQILQKAIYSSNGIEKNIILKLGRLSSLSKSRKRNKQITITYVGVVAKIRGTDIILKALDKISNRFGNFKLVLIGPVLNEDKEWLKRSINKLAWKKQVTTTGIIPHDKVIDLVSNSDICLFPFPRKNELEYIYPIKVFEYLAANKKVISSNLKGVVSILQNFKGTYVYSAGNSTDLAKKLIQAFSQKVKIDNAEKLLDTYQWEKINMKHIRGLKGKTEN